MIKFALAALFTLAQLGAASSGRVEAQGEFNNASRAPRGRAPEQISCGPNCVYVLLGLHGRSRTFASCQSTDNDPAGISLHTINELCQQHGLNTEVRKCKFEDLNAGLKLPLIAHFHKSPSGHHAGHYVVVLAANEEEVTVVDGTSGQIERYRNSNFKNVWSGYVVTPSQWWIDGRIAWAAGALIIIAAIVRLSGFVSSAMRRRFASIGKSSMHGGSGATPACFLAGVVLCAILSNADASDPHSPIQIWRSPERDGLNCLYIQLRLLGYQGSYAELLQIASPDQGALSLEQMCRIAKECGYALTPRQLTINELAALEQPVITLVEGGELNKGRYCLLLSLTERDASLIDGTFVTRHKSMSIDQFRREWTGLVLISEPYSLEPHWFARFRVGSIIGSLLGCLAFAIWWLKKS